MTAVAAGCKTSCNCPQVAAEFGEKLDYAITLLECLVRYMGLDVLAITGMKPPSGPNHSMLNKNRPGANFQNENHVQISHQNCRGTSNPNEFKSGTSNSSDDSSEKDMFIIPPTNGTGVANSGSPLNFNFQSLNRGGQQPRKNYWIFSFLFHRIYSRFFSNSRPTIAYCGATNTECNFNFVKQWWRRFGCGKKTCDWFAF